MSIYQHPAAARCRPILMCDRVLIRCLMSSRYMSANRNSRRPNNERLYPFADTHWLWNELSSVSWNFRMCVHEFSLYLYTALWTRFLYTKWNHHITAVTLWTTSRPQFLHDDVHIAVFNHFDAKWKWFFLNIFVSITSRLLLSALARRQFIIQNLNSTADIFFDILPGTYSIHIRYWWWHSRTI